MITTKLIETFDAIDKEKNIYTIMIYQQFNELDDEVLPLRKFAETTKGHVANFITENVYDILTGSGIIRVSKI
jgi:hypothetical protein